MDDRRIDWKNPVRDYIPEFRLHDAVATDRITGAINRQGVTTIVVGLDNDGQLTLTIGSQPTCKLRPYRSRTFVTDEPGGVRMEFHLGPDGEVDELFFHQPNGTLVARRTWVAASR
jgi:hypothetical protein